jgi:tetratricopeptide (TPR) repeat protein
MDEALGRSAARLDDLRRALGMYENCIVLAEAHNAARVPDALMNASWMLSQIGEYRRAFRLAKRAYRLASNAKQPVYVEHALGYMGMALFHLGRYRIARRLHERALALAMETNEGTHRVYVVYHLGVECAKIGMLEKGIAKIEECASLLRKEDVQGFLPRVERVLGVLYKAREKRLHGSNGSYADKE